ncbi:Chalcone isomerase protein [Dioscorea alata]|uniref:Chalcone isomerase protein n=1 Tax=Dioscorea alata TaxID=55571 RepID=A0ACB7W5W2_DIOAL|nr:Chalcone isomerase protein [Dioscorea alata]
MNKENDLETKVNEMKLDNQKDGKERETNAKVDDEEEEEVKMEVEAKTGVSFPVKLSDGKVLNSVGIRKKKILALGINIYTFGIYADNAALGKLLVDKFTKAPEEKPTKELYEAVINSDVGMMVRLVIVFGGLTMSMVRKNFDEGLGSSIKKLNGGQKNDELVNKVMGEAKDSIKLPSKSIIEITRMPGYVLQTKIKDELVSEVESELLCRAFFHMYLGDDPFDKEAKDKFGERLLTFF